MNDDTEFSPERGALIAGIIAITAACFYFLVFARFALLELIQNTAPERPLRLALAVLAAGGIGGSLLAVWRFRLERYPRALGTAFRACGLAAALALFASSWNARLLAAGVVGLTLGWLAVTLSAGLRSSTGTRWLGRCIGLGIGFAYASANLLRAFTVDAHGQTIAAALATVAGALACPWMLPQEPSVSTAPDYRTRGVTAWMAVLLALVWLDSAAFQAIRHMPSPSQQAATWNSLWTFVGQPLVQIGTAVLAGISLDRGWRGLIAVVGFAAIAAACFALNAQSDNLIGIQLLYTIGVSFYSTVLVYYPARGGRAIVAGAIVMVAGGLGSAFSIELAQDLPQVTGPILITAGVIVATGVAWRSRLQATPPQA